MKTFYAMQGGTLRALTADEAAPYASGQKRHRVENGRCIVFTDAEETAANAADAAWAAGAARRAAEDAERRLGKDRADREIAIAVLAADHPRRIAAEEVEQLWDALGVRQP